MVWCPNNGYECNIRIKPKPKTVFFITDYKLNKSKELSEIEKGIVDIFKGYNLEVDYARDIKRGKNMLCKICEAIQSVGIGVVLYSPKTPRKSIPNIFYEAALMYTLGKEVIVVGHKVKRPTDFEGIEWIHVKNVDELNSQLPPRIEQLFKQVESYIEIGENEEDVCNYTAAAEYYKKAVLIDLSNDSLLHLIDLSKKIKTIPGHLKLNDSIVSFTKTISRKSYNKINK